MSILVDGAATGSGRTRDAALTALVDPGNDPAGGRLFLRIKAWAIDPGFLDEIGVRPGEDMNLRPR